MRVDQGNEFISRDPNLWAYMNGVRLDFSWPGKSTDNALAEAFNGCVWEECLNAHWLLMFADAQKKLKVWRRYYNEERPHGAIGHKPPISLQIPVAHPARHRDEARKLYPPVLQRMGSDHQPNGSNLPWMRNGAQLISYPLPSQGNTAPKTLTQIAPVS